MLPNYHTPQEGPMAVHSKPAAKVQAQAKPMQAMKAMKAMKASLAMKASPAMKAMKAMETMKAMKGRKAMKGNEASNATQGPWPVGPTLALRCQKCTRSWVWLWKTYHRVKCQCGALWEASIPMGIHQRQDSPSHEVVTKVKTKDATKTNAKGTTNDTSNGTMKKPGTKASTMKATKAK